MFYLSHAYDGASENENEEAKDHNEETKANKFLFHSRFFERVGLPEIFSSSLDINGGTLR